MIVPFGQDPAQSQLAIAARQLESCNPAIGRYGLSLSAGDARALVAGRVEALRDTDRVEFGGGIAEDLVLAFASSPYVSQATFVATLLELQDLFYEVKNETLGEIPDDELIAKMRSLFDEFAGGDVGYLEEALLEGLGRAVREDIVAAGANDGDVALMNALTLAQHRFNVSDWVDDTCAPPWEGASWLDE